MYIYIIYIKATIEKIFLINCLVYIDKLYLLLFDFTEERHSLQLCISTQSNYVGWLL